MPTWVQDDAGNIRAFFMAVPLVPPSANTCVRHTRQGQHYVPANVKAFDQAVRLFARGHSIPGEAFIVKADVYLGFGQKGDADNFQKPLLDSLVKAGVISSDAKVRKCTITKYRDPKEPRTEISIELWKGER